MNFLDLPTGVQCPPAKSRFSLAIWWGLSEIFEEASMVCKDTLFQRFPNEGRGPLTNPFLQGASQVMASLGYAKAHWDRLLMRVIHRAL